MTDYPDRYIIVGKRKADALDHLKAGEEQAIYWTPDGGGWWQWGSVEAAKRFPSKDDDDFEDALLCAPTAGPWYNYVDPETVEVRAVPAIVKVEVY